MTTKANTQTKDSNALLVLLIEEVKKINQKLDFILKMSQSLQPKIQKNNKQLTESALSSDVLTLLSLPSTLRKTVIALYKLEEATAEEIANETKRMRAVESSAANQLSRMGYIKKKRKGHKVYFYIEPKMVEFNV